MTFDDNMLPTIDDPAVSLVRDERGLALVGDGMELRCDLAGMLPRIKPGRLSHELLVRAARVNHPRAIDATAGFGEDALLLAAAGFHVQLFEHDPVIAALLADGLARAAADPQLSPIASRMRLTCGDSVQALTARASMDVAKPDVVYLDPMFPARQKSAAVKKKFQLLHHLEAPCTDEEGLLRTAIACGPRKVVIKRPAKGPYLAGIKPSYSIDGKAVRYDCIVPASGCPMRKNTCGTASNSS